MHANGEIVEKEELHLFIIWEAARKYEKEIIQQIETKFSIMQTFSITWSPYLISRNFTRFYGESLPDDSDKELHCGGGEFKLVVVMDNNPVYEERKTSKGHKTVNTNMFDTKSKLRALTGGGHKIHGTDNQQETKHNLALLIGLSTVDFIKQYPQRKEDIILKQDLAGTNGWKSFDELFYILNECSEYVVLRNVKNINIEYFSNNEGDIDLLAKNASEISYVLGDILGAKKKNNHLKIDVERQIILFEVAQYGEGLFDTNFEDALLRTKVQTNNIWHLDKELEMYALLYHALLHKRSLEDKHKQRILHQYPSLAELHGDMEETLLLQLITYFKKHGYLFTPPDRGYFNFRPQIQPMLKTNKKRNLNRLKKIISIKRDRRRISVVLLGFIKKVFLLDILLPFSSRFKLSIGLK